MIFSMPLGLEISYFDGWCRYGSDNREWINGFINYKVGVDGISILFLSLSKLA